MATSNGENQRPPPQRQQSQGLPSISSLTNGLPAASQRVSSDQLSPESTRDSGTWPQPHSKHNSANSGLQVSTLLNPDDSPQRQSIPTTPLSARMPQSAQSTGSQLPSINQGFQDGQPHPNHRDSYNRDSYHPSIDSRRSSVDSRMHQGLNNLYINNPNNPTSPYESANASQVSLAASLRRPNNGQPPMSPLSGRSSSRASHLPPRVAPPIMPVGRQSGAPDPTAAKPTQGYAWAFPDGPIPEERRGSDSDESSLRGISRTNSLAASSIRSSIFSNDSHMPGGQRRLDDDATTHHHTLQHRTIASIQNESMPSQGIGNYSRTPELRVSHKLAERKRRSEMKDLFEDLNKAVPSNAGTKASKWEILTKAIDYIRSTQHQERQLHSEVQRLQRDSEYVREAQKENEMLKTEISVMHQHLRRLDPNTPHIYGHFTNQLAQQPSTAQQPQTNGATQGISLPPLSHTASNGAAPQPQAPQFGNAPAQPSAPGAMQGVEYGYGGR